MSQGTEELSSVWDEISDAELLSIQSEYLSTEPLPGGAALQDGQTAAKLHGSTESGVFSEKATGTVSSTEDEKSCDPVQKRKRQSGQRTPMELFNRRHLKVTEVCRQTWCELQVVYGLERPQVAKREAERPEVQAGASIHLARELEVHDVVPVHAVTREDYQAISFLNLLGMMPALQAGNCVRELPVFGVLEGVYMVGVIDELRYNEHGELVLSELKTRRQNSVPDEAQAKGHRLQVCLYKLLFDGLVRGTLTRAHVVDHLRLRLNQVLGHGVLEHAGKLGIQVVTFGELLDLLLLNLTYCELPGVDRLHLEYRHQDSGNTLGTQDIPFDEDHVRAELQHHLSYWMGQRGPRGVDIEDAWKCRMCLHEKHCRWRGEGFQQTATVHTDKKIK